MFDVAAVRPLFPSLSQAVDNHPVAFFDNPGGTQCPQMVIDAMVAYLATDNANYGGRFATSRRTTALVAEARGRMAALLGAPSADEIVFGPNMTSLTFSLSRALARRLRPGDELVVTRLDHDANITPWVLAARDAGAVVRWADIHPDDCTLDTDGLLALLNERTRIVAIGYASNSVGTINDVKRIAAAARTVGALTFVDAVQFTPHALVDVADLRCDFLACSVYKFYGPHVGVLYGRREHLDALEPYKVRPASDLAPFKFETGTANFEGLAGARAAVDYLGVLAGDNGTAACSSRGRLRAAMAAVGQYEQELTRRLLDGLQSVRGLRIYGITDPARISERVPTISFTLAGYEPRQVSEYLAGRGMFVWDGHYYALALVERLGLGAQGGMVRVGLAHYNTAGEIDRLVAALDDLASPVTVAV